MNSQNQPAITALGAALEKAMTAGSEKKGGEKPPANSKPDKVANKVADRKIAPKTAKAEKPAKKAGPPSKPAPPAKKAESAYVHPVIYTHKSVDVDAAFSVAAVRLFRGGFGNAQVLFVRQGDPNVVLPAEAFEVVDMTIQGQGIKGVREHDGRTHCAFKMVLERFAKQQEQKILAPLVKVLDGHDMEKDAYGPILASMGITMEAEDIVRYLEDLGPIGAFRSAKAGKYANGVRALDIAMVLWCEEQILGMLETGRSRILAQEQISEAIREPGKNGIRMSDDMSVALIYGNESHSLLLQSTMFDRFGVKIVVSLQGNGLSVVRNHGMKALRLDADASPIRAIISKSQDNPRDWFWHSAGWHVTRGGSKKGRQDYGPSTVNPEDLFKAAQAMLKPPPKAKKKTT